MNTTSLAKTKQVVHPSTCRQGHDGEWGAPWARRLKEAATILFQGNIAIEERGPDITMSSKGIWKLTNLF